MYCNAVFAWAPKTITDRLQRVLNAAARVVSETPHIRDKSIEETTSLIQLKCD